MCTITVTLPDEQATLLREVADRLRVSAEDLVQATIEDMLAQPDEQFRRTAEFVLAKNAELYHRLAE